MSFYNEKWNNSSVLTKAAAWTMLLNSFFLLVCAFILNYWGRTIISLMQMASEEALPNVFNYYVLLLLVIFFYNALFTFGLVRVSRAARFLTILQGIGAILGVVFSIVSYRYIMAEARNVAVSTLGEPVVGAAEAVTDAYSGLVGSLLREIMPRLLAMIPPSVWAQIGFYLIAFISPFFLQVISMLILFFCGKDFRKIKSKKLKKRKEMEED